jgi:hypothetical protein
MNEPTVMFQVSLNELVDQITEKNLTKLPGATDQNQSAEIIDSREVMQRLAISEPTLISLKRKRKYRFLK